MVLGFKEKFPDNSPTNFVEAILDGRKKHSIRNGMRWHSGMPIHMATGVRTKNYKQFKQDRVVSTENIIIFPKTKEVVVGVRTLSDQEVAVLAQNDGLSVERFWEWFGKDAQFIGQIIHWTPIFYDATLHFVLKNVVFELIEYAQTHKTSSIPQDKLSHIFKKLDHYDLLGKASIEEIKSAYWDIAYQLGPKEYFEIFFIEPFLNEGLALVNDSYRIQNVRTNVTVVWNKPLSLEALTYHYSNDKSPLKD